MTIPVLDANGTEVEVNTLPALGRASAASSLPMALSTEDKTALDLLATKADSQIGLIGSTNTKLDSVVTALTTIDGRVDGLEPGIGVTSESAAASDTATSGLNGLMKRLLQRVTTLLSTGIPVTTLPALAAGTNNIGDVDIASSSGQFAEDAAHSSGAVGNFVLSVRSDTAASTAGTTGDYAGLITDSTGKLWVNLTELATLTGAQGATAWASGDGTLISLLKAIAGAAISTTPAEVRVTAAEFETVAASQTDQMLGATGGAGDTLSGLLVIPATTSPGAVSIEYGATNITVFAGGASSVSNLIPFYIPLENIAAPSGGWEITTGANVSVIAFGNFT